MGIGCLLAYRLGDGLLFHMEVDQIIGTSQIPHSHPSVSIDHSIPHPIIDPRRSR